MQNYQFNMVEYKKKISSPTNNVSFVVIIFVCIILMGAVLFLKPKAKNYNYFYFVEINNFLVLSDAQNLSNEIQNKGGAGYVFFDGKYHILANYYLTKTEAENVCKNLKADYPSVKVFKLKTNKNFNINNLNKNQKKAVENLITAGYETIKLTYNSILQFDKLEIDENALTLNFATLQTKFEDVVSEFNSCFSSNSKFEKPKTYILKMRDVLKNLANITSQENFKQKMKFEMVSLVVNFNNALSSF